MKTTTIDGLSGVYVRSMPSTLSVRILGGQESGEASSKNDVEIDQLLKKAAGAAGEALAVYAFGPAAAQAGQALGEAIFGAIVGGIEDPEHAFREEVGNSLQRIEGKLNDIINFLQRDLPQVVRVITNDSFATNLSLQLAANRATTLGMLHTLSSCQGAIPDDEFVLAVNIANKSFELGITLMHYGQEWYSGVIHAYVNGLTLYGRLIRQRKAFQGFLVEYALVYQEFVRACLSDFVPSSYWVAPPPAENFAMAKSRIAREETYTTQVLTRVREGRVSYLLGLNSPLGAYGGWYTMVSNGTGFDGNRLYIEYTVGPRGVGDPIPQCRSEAELIARSTAALHWEIPSFKEVIDITKNFRRDPYEEMVQVLCSALSTENRNKLTKPAVLVAVATLEAIEQSIAQLTGGHLEKPPTHGIIAAAPN